MEETAHCPKCHYVSPDEEFSICPKCGIIIKKYYNTLGARQKLEAEKNERRQRAEEEAKLIAQQEEIAQAKKQQEEALRREQKRQEKERKCQKHSAKHGVAAASFIFGVLLLAAGLLTEPGEGGGVNLHRLHIKQSLYTLGGVFLIISVINNGVEKLLKAMADIHRNP